MREIKFRAWNQGRMYIPTIMANPTPSKINGDALMQYTGLLDKNGVEIYEGDIVGHPLCVKDPHDGDEPCETFVGRIQFETDRGQWFAVNSQRNGYVIELSEAYKFEVIGNIYEVKNESK